MEHAPHETGSPGTSLSGASAGPPEPGAQLTIGDLADRTGVSAATLRMWESRYGFPVPHRLDSGHRRYADTDVELIRSVVRHKDSGLRLERAIAKVLTLAAPTEPSIYSVLRARHPAVVTYRLTKRTLLGLSWAIEDEFCAHAHEADIYGAFQRGRYFRHSEPRWTELARTARSATVFADFERTDQAAHPVEVRLPENSPMLREWAIVCDSPDLPVVLTAWELAGQHDVRDRDRVFESMWTVDPRAVHDAARVCASVAGQPPLPAAPRAEAQPDLAAVTRLYNRIVWYVDRLD
jgi:DNA-binding transcriptional MerR regulator